MNQCIFLGRLVRPVELRHTTAGTPVASFTLAVDGGKDGDGNRKTLFVDFVAWRNTAELADNHMQKGSMYAVVSKFQLREWVDKDGGKRKSPEFIVDNIYFTGERKVQDYGCNSPAFEAPTADFAELEDDDPLPF
jgi:single-strand DNA-binding protein